MAGARPAATARRRQRERIAAIDLAARASAGAGRGLHAALSGGGIGPGHANPGVVRIGPQELRFAAGVRSPYRPFGPKGTSWCNDLRA
jgi:hypothetical protein